MFWKGARPYSAALSFPFGRSSGNTPTRNVLEDFEILQVVSLGQVRQLFKAISISVPKWRDTCCLTPRLTNGNILKALGRNNLREKE